MIQTGTNDAAAGTTVATYMSILQNMVTKIINAGQRPILTTPVPNGGGSTPRLLIDKYRRAVTYYAIQNGFPLVDFSTLLTDPSTGSYLAAYDSGDQTHPNALGYRAMGQAIVDQMAGFIQPLQFPTTLHNAALTDTVNGITNPLFLTDVAPADGTPDTWTKVGTGAAGTGIVTGDAAIKGNALRIVDTASTGTISFTSANYALGASKLFAFMGRIKIVGQGQFTLTATTSGGGAFIQRLASNFVPPPINDSTGGWKRFYLVGRSLSNSSTVAVVFSSPGGTNVDVSIAEIGVVDLTALGF
jgi:hypothetical protein